MIEAVINRECYSQIGMNSIYCLFQNWQTIWRRRMLLGRHWSNGCNSDIYVVNNLLIFYPIKIYFLPYELCWNINLISENHLHLKCFTGYLHKCTTFGGSNIPVGLFGESKHHISETLPLSLGRTGLRAYICSQLPEIYWAYEFSAGLDLFVNDFSFTVSAVGFLGIHISLFIFLCFQFYILFLKFHILFLWCCINGKICTR